MSNITEVTIMELFLIKETLELALEEFNGINEAKYDLNEYVCTTGAEDLCKDALKLINKLVYNCKENTD